MCKLKSMIALKGRIYMADADSHSDMLDELGIKDDYLGASKKFVRLELSPEDVDPFSDVDTWVLKVDQDIKPDWYSDEEYKPMAVEAVKEWAKTHIFVGVDGLKLHNGTNYYIKDCKDVEICGSASVYAWGSASVKACDYASVYACDYASVYACDYASVKACDYASVKACGSASVYAWGSASVKACDYASVYACGSAVVFNSSYSNWNNRSSLILSENATFKDNIEKVIYQSGDFKLVSVESGKTISECKVL